jgi:outer membrane biosynthesis protein TonB
MALRAPWPLLMWALLACTQAAGTSGSLQPKVISSKEKYELPACALRSVSDTIWSEEDLDAPFQLVASRPPRYPQSLLAEGRGGSVEWAFIVTPLGRVDPCSLELRHATHPDLIEPSRATFLSAQFTSPTRHGMPVFVRITNTLHFKLRR